MRAAFLACVLAVAGCSSDDVGAPQSVDPNPTWQEYAEAQCEPICARRAACGLVEDDCAAACLAWSCTQVDCASPCPWSWAVTYDEMRIREQMSCEKALAIRF